MYVCVRIRVSHKYSCSSVKIRKQLSGVSSHFTTKVVTVQRSLSPHGRDRRRTGGVFLRFTQVKKK